MRPEAGTGTGSWLLLKGTLYREQTVLLGSAHLQA